MTAAVEAYQALIEIVGVSLLVLAAMTSERTRAEANAEERACREEQTRRALEREHEAVGRLMELDELKITFLHAVSHDLRTPLASILGIARTLEREDLAFPKEEVRHLAARIVRNARRLHKLVSDLLDYERLERGALGAEPSAPTSASWFGRWLTKWICATTPCTWRPTRSPCRWTPRRSNASSTTCGQRDQAHPARHGDLAPGERERRRGAPHRRGLGGGRSRIRARGDLLPPSPELPTTRAPPARAPGSPSSRGSPNFTAGAPG